MHSPAKALAQPAKVEFIRHPEHKSPHAYGCSLPGLTRFTPLPCSGPDKHHLREPGSRRNKLAERGGFEPPATFWAALAFQASSLSRSVTSPYHACSPVRRLGDRIGGAFYRSRPVLRNLSPYLCNAGFPRRVACPMLFGMADTHNEPYQVVARRFRPKAFAEVVGQEAIQTSLKSAIDEGRIPHAFLFAGSRGIGKTTMARILARCLNCEQGPTAEPCGVCSQCLATLAGSNPDVLEIDAASNRRIDDMRPLIERVATVSMRSRYKVYILDEVHMLTKEAFNALLKTLEEPPAKVVFVLATTELHKVPDTIRSRCQVHHFRRIDEDDIVRRLRMIAVADGVSLPEDVLAEIALTSRGGMRDAETALERVLSMARAAGGVFDLAALRELSQRLGHDRALEIAAALLAGDAAAGLRFAKDLQQSGVDEREALGDLVEVLRSALLFSIDGPESTLVSYSGALRLQLQALAAKAEPQRLLAMIQACLLGRERLRRLDDRAAVLDLTIVRMAQAGALPTLGQLVAAVRDGVGVMPTASGSGGSASAISSRPSALAVTSTATTNIATANTGGDGGDGGLRSRLLASVRDQLNLHTTLEGCRYEGPDANGRVVVVVLTEKKIYRDRLHAPGLQQQIQGLIQVAAGRPVNVEWQFQAPGGDVLPPSLAAIPPSAAAERVMKAFGGRVIAINPPDTKRSAAPQPEPPHDPSTEPTDVGDS